MVKNVSNVAKSFLQLVQFIIDFCIPCMSL